MILVEPGEGVAPRRRGRGRGKKWMRENVMNQGTMKDFFPKLRILKECLDEKMVRKEGGTRKRLLEADGEDEQCLEPARSKTRRTMMEWSRNPDDLTVPGGKFLEMGAQSLSGRDPTDGQKMGDKNLGLIGNGLKEWKLEDSRGTKTDGQKNINIHV